MSEKAVLSGLTVYGRLYFSHRDLTRGATCWKLWRGMVGNKLKIEMKQLLEQKQSLYIADSVVSSLLATLGHISQNRSYWHRQIQDFSEEDANLKKGDNLLFCKNARLKFVYSDPRLIGKAKDMKWMKSWVGHCSNIVVFRWSYLLMFNLIV